MILLLAACAMLAIISLMWLHIQTAIFTAECYGNAATVTVNVLQIDLLQLLAKDYGRIIELSTTSLQHSTVLSDTSKFLLIIRGTFSAYNIIITYHDNY